MKHIDFPTAVLRAREASPEGGIGTLGEKLLHRALKYWYEPDGARHELPVGGFFADILNGDGITEIQTGSFYHIDRKLEEFLKAGRVTLVCPIVRRRRIITIDPATGEAKKPRLSPKKGRVEDVFLELVHILKRLSDPNLVIAVPLVDADEYRVKRGPKRRYHDRGYDRAELEPTELVGEWVFVTREDWLRLLPDGAERFTAKELAEMKKLPLRTAQAMCKALLRAGALEREKVGRSYTYYEVTGGSKVKGQNY